MGEGIRVGDLLASKYRLEALLGSGGMGDVYRAVNEDVGRAVAIKVLRGEHTANAPLVERFLREAKAANLVRHPNVVDVLDIGRSADGAPFIVQELLKGEDLLQHLAVQGGRLRAAPAFEIILPVVDAVAEAHARGVVHRDIKPANVFLAREGPRTIPKLLDFGISKVRLPDTRVTEVGVMMGTPAYMAPEQIQGAHEADPRTDVWGLGVLMFEVLSGKLPFDGAEAPQLFVAIATTDAPRLVDVCPDVAADISAVVERCLRRRPEGRYESASELARDLRDVLAGAAPRTRRAAPTFDVPELELRPSSRGSERRVAAVAALLPTALAAPPPAAAVAPPAPLAAPPPAAGLTPPAPAAPAPPPSATRRAVPVAHVHARLRPAVSSRPPDVATLIGLAVIAATALGTLVLLVAFVHQPGGFSVVALVTTPAPIVQLVVQGGLGAGGAAFAFHQAVRARRAWHGDENGGRRGAVTLAAFAGALLFAAIELGRAAM